MPLISGDSDDIIQSNFKELKNSGFGEAQSWAIALKKARKGKTANRVASKVAARPRKMKVDVK